MVDLDIEGQVVANGKTKVCELVDNVQFITVDDWGQSIF
jgi:hypothetical protein